MVPTRDTQTRRQSGTHRRVSECLQGPQGSVSGLVRVEKHLTGLCSSVEWKAKAAGDHAPSRRSLCLAHSIFQCSSVGPGRNSSVRVLFEGEMGMELGCQRVKSQPHPDHHPALWTLLCAGRHKNASPGRPTQANSGHSTTTAWPPTHPDQTPWSGVPFTPDIDLRLSPSAETDLHQHKTNSSTDRPSAKLFAPFL